MIELIAFLGNPGREYERTRHNAGRLLAEKLPFYEALPWQNKYKGRYAALDYAALACNAVLARNAALDTAPPGDAGEGRPAGPASQNGGPDGTPGRLHFIIPETFMNNSGESVQAAAAFFKIPPERIMVVHDELEMPLGTAGFKFGGGLGGHNGLRSMNACFGTGDFWRLRVGIGRPGDREPGKGGPQGVHGDIIGWVLSAFGREEFSALEQVLDAAAAALVRALLQGAETLLPEWKKRSITINF
jgi:PTH1 family peptidyl-tRNA hydrolase